jgi:nitroreductase
MRHAVVLLFAAALAAPAADLTLPKPEMKGGKPVMDTLAGRRSGREFSSKPLPPQVLSNLLWAAYGVNRPATGGRTAPSAHNWQAVDIYVAMEKALYLYDAKAHVLREVAATDARPLSTTQDFANTAPVNLVLVARMAKTQRTAEDSEADILSWVSMEAGAIVQNVGLYCVSAGLENVVRAGVQRPAFAKLAGLAGTDNIVVAQTVGYAK